MSRIPEEIKQYVKFFNNTGGNDPEDLLRDLEEDKNILQTNIARAIFGFMTEAQVKLLQTLRNEDLLLSPRMDINGQKFDRLILDSKKMNPPGEIHLRTSGFHIAITPDSFTLNNQNIETASDAYDAFIEFFRRARVDESDNSSLVID
jgi:hypothetical protein